MVTSSIPASSNHLLSLARNIPDVVGAAVLTSEDRLCMNVDGIGYHNLH